MLNEEGKMTTSLEVARKAVGEISVFIIPV